MTLDVILRRHIYDLTLAIGEPPKASTLARATNSSESDVAQSLKRLEAARFVILQPRSNELLMVPPFSAVPTPFRVETMRHAAYANCAWDALGVPVMMRQTGRVKTACACCGEAMTLDVSPDRAPAEDFVVHFAVPAAKWWTDIVYT